MSWTSTFWHRSFLEKLMVIASAALLLHACGGGNSGGTTTAPVNHWTWVAGSNAVGQAGSYGTLGVATSTNIPGARNLAISWTDTNNTLWLFGGIGHDHAGKLGALNDLWRFDPASGRWTWTSGSNTVDQVSRYGTQGVADTTNVPGGRSIAVSWTGRSNTLWLFGGTNTATGGFLNDLWVFDTSTSRWTWVAGSNTTDQAGNYGIKGVAAPNQTPGARMAANSWVDANNHLWLFGGAGLGANGSYGLLNDLWKFDGRHWAWVSGSDAGNQAGNYGTLGVAVSTNVPGARQDAVTWTDGRGILWLFGGYGYDSAGSREALSDLWKFDSTTNLWTWVSGNTIISQSGSYGIQGTAAASNVPGGRDNAISWTDSGHNLWLFGGYGVDSTGTLSDLNDLWKFDTVSGLWIWVSGSSLPNQSGSYGTPGVAALTNVPGARQRSVSWIDNSNTLWLFGGSGRDSAGAKGYLNDLWRYQP